jgi:hypothetical protein
MAYEVAARHLSCERHSTTLRQIGISTDLARCCFSWHIEMTLGGTRLP